MARPLQSSVEDDQLGQGLGLKARPVPAISPAMDLVVFYLGGSAHVNPFLSPLGDDHQIDFVGPHLDCIRADNCVKNCDNDEVIVVVVNGHDAASEPIRFWHCNSFVVCEGGPPSFIINSLYHISELVSIKPAVIH